MTTPFESPVFLVGTAALCVVLLLAYGAMTALAFAVTIVVAVGLLIRRSGRR